MKALLAASAALLVGFTAPAWAAEQSQAIVPDPTLTPGAVRTTDVGEICSTPTSSLRHWDRARDNRILAEYGLPPGPHPDYEVDHLIPLCLGGSDADSNLWPEPRRSLEPEWNAERKDRLEATLCQAVCAGGLAARVRAKLREFEGETKPRQPPRTNDVLAEVRGELADMREELAAARSENPNAHWQTAPAETGRVMRRVNRRAAETLARAVLETDGSNDDDERGAGPRGDR
jgi:hypothetical protein